MKRIAIIGAGIAGLACARTLIAAGHKVDIFEKSRGLGGRLASRRRDVDGVGQVIFDHGAQFFKAHNSHFETVLAAAQDDGSAARWTPRIRHQDSDGRQDTDFYVATPGMSALVKPWIDRAHVHLGARVAKISRTGDGYLLGMETSDAPEEGPFDEVVVAVPVDQARPLADTVEDFDPRLRQRLDEVEMAPCWAALLAFATPLRTQWDLHIADAESPVAWAARNSSKPGRDEVPDCWVVHAGGIWSELNLERTADDVLADLIAGFVEVVGDEIPETVYAAAHRWRYARTLVPIGSPFVRDVAAGISFCGDWCLGARVEAAFDSGAQLGQHLLSEFS